jgi:hypothetical protein
MEANPMPTIPDDHQPRHDAAQQDPAITLAGLRNRYGDRWEILVHLDSSVVSAEHRSADGRAVRYLVAHSVAELAAKLATAECVEPTGPAAGA